MGFPGDYFFSVFAVQFIYPLTNINQHVFVSKCSIVSKLQLVEFTKFISKNIDNNKDTDTTVTNFTEVIDCTNHNLVLNKMDAIGFPAELVTLFKSLLKNRKNYLEDIGNNC